jgi:hypothetical protein
LKGSSRGVPAHETPRNGDGETQCSEHRDAKDRDAQGVQAPEVDSARIGGGQRVDRLTNARAQFVDALADQKHPDAREPDNQTHAGTPIRGECRVLCDCFEQSDEERNHEAGPEKCR